jgi:hypothetical protein
MLWPAMKEDERRPVVAGSRDVHPQARRLDQLVVDPANGRKVPIEHGRRVYAAASGFLSPGALAGVDACSREAP